MSRLAGKAIVLSIARIANYGLMLLSPVLLVRILPVEQFGRYREFLVYTSLLIAIAGFNINDSLLYFIPAHARSRWLVVRQTTLLVSARLFVARPATQRVCGSGFVGIARRGAWECSPSTTWTRGAQLSPGDSESRSRRSASTGARNGPGSRTSPSCGSMTVHASVLRSRSSTRWCRPMPLFSFLGCAVMGRSIWSTRPYR